MARLTMLVLVAFTCTSMGQNVGDYRSVTSGYWDAATTWEVFNGTGWSPAAGKPCAADTVYLQVGTAVSLRGDEACATIYLNSTSQTRLALETFTLSVFGALASYNSAAGVFPVTWSTPSSAKAWITSTTGKISLEGSTRVVADTSRWSAGNAGASAPNGFDLEINMNQGDTAKTTASIKARRIRVNSGILCMGTRLSADSGSTGCGSVYIAGGATLLSSMTGVTVMSRTTDANAGYGGMLTIAQGGRLVLIGAKPRIGMQNYQLDGSVEYASPSGQTLATASNGGSPPSVYTDLVLSGSGIKRLGVNTSVSGVLHMAGRSVLNLDTLSLTYLQDSGLRYCGDSAQTTSDAEWPVSGGPHNVKIDNVGGVSLHSSLTVSDTLELIAGALRLGGHDLKLGQSDTETGNLSLVAGYLDGTGSFTRWFDTAAVTIPSIKGMFPFRAGPHVRTAWLGCGSMTSSGTVTIAYNDSTGTSVVAPAFSDGGVIVNQRHNMSWTVDTGSGVAGVFALRLAGAGIPGINSIPDLRLVRASDAVGTAQSGAGTVLQPLVERTGLTASELASRFFFGSSSTVNPMPVELVCLSASRCDGAVKLVWKTASETNCHGFVVQRAYASSLWEDVGFVEGQGNSSLPREYTYIDKVAAIRFHDVVRYRLKQIDRDDRFEYSTPVEIRSVVPGKPTLETPDPNPFVASTVLRFYLPEDADVRIEIYDMTGRRIAVPVSGFETSGPHAVLFRAGSLSTGVYFCVMRMAGRVEITKAVKVW